MAEANSYWQIFMQQLCKITNSITNALNNIAAIFSRPAPNTERHNTEQQPKVTKIKYTATREPAIIPLTREMVSEIVAGYRRGLAGQLRVRHFPGINIYGTIKDSDDELRKLELAAAKAQKEMYITNMNVAQMQIEHLKARQQQLEEQVTELKEAEKLPLLDMEMLSSDLPDIMYDEEPPETIVPADANQVVVSPRSMKSKIPRPIPPKPKKEINGVKQSPRVKVGCKA